MARMSKFGANPKIVSGHVKIRMPFSQPRGDVKKVMDWEGFHGEVSGLGIEIGVFISMKVIFKFTRWLRSL